MEDLEKKRKDLESKLASKEKTHYAKPHWASESAYRDSVKEIREVYEQLFTVAYELGDPVPIWF
tara:strand:+ start:240 stop:431 length:192 start_codon:yes stop_codon:yes gene_type:complete